MKLKKHLLNQYLWALLFIAPTMIGLFILNVWPIIQTLFLSFTKSGDFGKFVFVGFATIKKVLGDAEVWKSTWNTFLYTIMVVPISTVLALIFAVLINQEIKGRTLLRLMFFIPVVSTPAAVAMVWKWLYNGDYGLINFVTSKLIGIRINWLTAPSIVMVSLAIVGIWMVVGYNMILFLAGLQGIPKTYYEAAHVDGAGKIFQFFNITIPLVSPTTFFVVVITMIQSLQIFDIIYMMVDKLRNPAYPEAQTLAVLFYRNGFIIHDKSAASVVVFLLFSIIMLITILQFVFQKKWVHYE